MLGRYQEVVVLCTKSLFRVQGRLRVNVDALGLDHDQASVNAFDLGGKLFLRNWRTFGF
jgi:hypothetical protein